MTVESSSADIPVIFVFDLLFLVYNEDSEVSACIGKREFEKS